MSPPTTNPSWLQSLFGVLLVGGMVGIPIHRVRGYFRRRNRSSVPKPVSGLMLQMHVPASCIKDGDVWRARLDSSLSLHGHGRVAGCRYQLNAKGGVEWVGMSLELSNFGEAMKFARQELAELGVPPGSRLEYRLGDRLVTSAIADSRAGAGN